VLKDPDSGGSDRGIALQTAMLQEISAGLNSAVALSNGIASVRSQLQTLMGKLASDNGMVDVRAAANIIEQKFSAAADLLRQQKPVAFYEWPVKLEAKLIYLAYHVQSSDYEPTDQAREAHVFLKGQLRIAKSRYDELMRRDLATFNELLLRRGLQQITIEQR
jgi:hypothetical protein